MVMARQNARAIIKNTTAYPFRLPGSSPVCVFCNEDYEDPTVFRRHMNDEHQTFNMVMAFAHIKVLDEFIKVDITDLRCRRCQEKLKNLPDAGKHLNEAHSLEINLNYDFGVKPFIIESDKLLCAICKMKHNNLRSLSRHTSKHFVQFTCDACGKSYLTATSLKYHIADTHSSLKTSERACRKCKKVFNSTKELRQHLEQTKKCCGHLCGVCGERFPTWSLKQEHMRNSHALATKRYNCPECNEGFDKSGSYRTHFKIMHTENHFACSCCGRKFDTEYNMKRHMVSHTGQKDYKCQVCFKAFPRKSTLTQHMWIHSENKKWKCESCNKQFNQRVSWKSHMKSHHGICDL